MFFDPKSSESALPYFSNGERDDSVQRNYLQGLIGYWQVEAGHNPVSSVYGAPMIDPEQIHVWCWDARPYPDFPARVDVWSDGINWARGHWISGRVGATLLPDVVRDIAQRNGGLHIDVSQLNGCVTGYTLDRPMSARAALQPLADVYEFECMETPQGLMFYHPGDQYVHTLTADMIEADAAQATALHYTRADAAKELQDVRLHFIDIGRDYQRASVSARDRLAARDYVTDIEAPLALGRSQARAVCARIIKRSGHHALGLNFTVMPSAIDVKLGDGIKIEGEAKVWQILGLDGTFKRAVTARPMFKTGAGFKASYVPENLAPIVHAARPHMIALDIVNLGTGTERSGPIVAAYSKPWMPVSIVHENASVTLEQSSRFGTTLTQLPKGVIGRIDDSFRLTLRMANAQLSSKPLSRVASGANAIALKTELGWEVIQFLNAELIGPNTYALSKLLRGQSGSDGFMAQNLEAGAIVVLLPEQSQALPIDTDLRGAQLTLSAIAGREATATHSLDYQGVHMIPLSPVHVKARLINDELVLTWIRRTRLGGDDWASVDVPMAQEREAYSVQLVQDNAVTFECEVLRAECTLSSAALTALNLHSKPYVKVRIAQLSQRVGAGYALEADVKVWR